MVDFRKFYARVTNPYHAVATIYSGKIHHGVDYAAGSHAEVPSYFNGTCVLNGHSSFLGNYTVLRRSDGKYVGYAHCLVGTRPDVGAKVKPGDTIYRAAGPNDDHGSQWTGPHCHTTLSAFVTGIYDGRTLDPTPGIRAAIAKVSAKPAAAAKQVKVTVKARDTLTKIAARAKTTVKAVMALNPSIHDEDEIWVGQVVRVK
jgi:murein DD-endopeptidase MepM/ murein hydrolase activator NlpD